MSYLPYVKQKIPILALGLVVAFWLQRLRWRRHDAFRRWRVVSPPALQWPTLWMALLTELHGVSASGRKRDSNRARPHGYQSRFHGEDRAG
jgi:hypothetical protein